MPKINLNFKGKNYSIDKSLLAGAISDLEATLSGLQSGGASVLEGDGSEYYTLAPTALTFRSTEPLADFQEVKVNGDVVDPSNYTLEEGSTIVTLSIDYLKTLPVGAYDIEVVSANNAPSGKFTVAAPELNEHGFYYNQPYTVYVAPYQSEWCFFFRENGNLDFINLTYGDTEVCTFEVSGSNIMTHSSLGDIPATVASANEIYCAALGISFTLGNEHIIADSDYVYIYKEDLGGYEVNTIDKTKAEYGAIKTSINGINTIKLATLMFADLSTAIGNHNMVNSPKIPNTVRIIGGGAFIDCANMVKVEIPDSVTTIEQESFSGCTNLEEVVIGNGVTFIGENAFKDCANLKLVNISDIVKWCNISFENNESNPLTYGNCNLFINNEPIVELEIPYGATTIPYDTFYRERSLVSVVIPNSVTSIGNSAFTYCTSLTSVNIPDSVTSIGESAFEGCTSLTSINIPDSVTNIGDHAFNYCTSLTSVNIPNSVTSIEWYTFANCKALSSVTISNSVTNIGHQTFSGCEALTDITFNGTITQWNAITKDSNWNSSVPATYVQCSDGQVAL